ncbi:MULTISPECIES: hypothetical protein [unclassified Rhizobium]|uniref:hypothetical protein n=1 Tax=unclassified Rhizobium TaxID=2613769 RepID=UPI001AD95381|nr:MULTISPECIES: hypothetical protein [unclassified Rhizobium]MBO9098185.1 hypothetical protein [Rhizobium sp. L58/93]MBO9133033.1 hypothetical protein [Rhizobium sp. B209b/85]MBO9168335.1 hypothetical protein [Rhizobium sp. L245/93]MBO9184381.1 hypothetical protein [Rhizobium sp. E27B/91]QXZ84570.1 hypothetical protein J5287_03225 [Rhizobium sp. K1/93]
MIRFAPQTAAPSPDRQARALKPALAADEAGNGAFVPTDDAMLIPDLEDAGGDTSAKSTKSRLGRKQKTKSAVAEAAVQLDLNA